MDFTATIPDEMLSHIFSYVRLDELRSTRHHRYRLRPAKANLGWIRITFVNSRWRRVAIDNANFWTQLDGSLGSAWLDEFICRSKNAPLAIDDRLSHDLDESTSAHFYHLMNTQRARIISMCLSSTLNHHSSFIDLDELVSCEYENVEELNLSISYTFHTSAVVNRCNALLENIPRLLRLSLSFLAPSLDEIDWTTPCFTRLVSLNLHGASEALFAPKILDALRQMDALAQLSLDESSTSRPSITPLSCNYRCSGTSEDVIRLEQARSISLGGSVELLTHLLRHFQAPPHARVALECLPKLVVSSEQDTSDTFAQALLGFCPCSSQIPSFLSAYISFKGQYLQETCASLSLNRGHRPAYPINEREDIPEGGSTHEPLRGNDLTLSWADHDTLASVIQQPQFTTAVKALTLSGAGRFKELSYLSHFPNVERLCLRTSAPGEISLHGLGHLMDATVFPKLRFVDLGAQEYTLSAIFTCFALDGPHRGLATKRFPALEDVLEARRASGKPLEAIYLHVADEVALVEDGRMGETSCPNYERELVLESVRQLRTVQGVEIVGKDFDVFGM
ncbi:unnamed protein product [Peniophora sp. CBMAI 1063]|nr:unnamed protein product [Peniophora sp. CBMAI 1063]